jgi:RNA polymerase sigma factor (sigma-70 family)
LINRRPKIKQATLRKSRVNRLQRYARAPRGKNDGSGRRGIVIALGLERHECRYLRQAFAHELRIRAYLRSAIHDEGFVEEMLQEVYLRLLEAGISNRSEVRSVLAFSLGIARNLAIDRLRSRRPTSVENIEEIENLEELPMVEHAPSLDEIVDSEAQSDRLRKAIDDLPERSRQALRLQVYGDLTYKEIARELGTSEGTVGQYLIRAVRLLSAALGVPLSRQKPNDRARSVVVEEDES